VSTVPKLVLTTAAADGRPAQVRAPRNITLAVNLNGVLNTCVVARECWKKQPSVTDRRLVVLSSMGGITGIPAAVSYRLRWS